MGDTAKTETDSRVGDVGKRPEALADEPVSRAEYTRERAESRAEHSRELAELRAEMQRLGAGSGIAPTRADGGGSAMGTGDSTPRRRRRRARGAAMVQTAERGAPVSRRRLFGLLGGAAAVGTGLAVAGSTLAADSAGAQTVVGAATADNEALAMGDLNTGSLNTTQLVGSTNTSNDSLLLVKQQSATDTTVAIQAVCAGNGTNECGVNSVVSGSGNTDVGVIGNATGSGNGNFGVSGAASGSGIAGVGVAGLSTQTDGIGLLGNAFSGAPLQLVDNAQTMPPTTGTWLTGMFVVSGGHLWFCSATGTAGTGSPPVFERLSPLVTIPPARVYDSRASQSPTTGPKSPITNGLPATVNVDVTGTQATPPGGPSGVPVGVSAVLGNVTLVTPSNGVFLTLYASGTTEPSTSNINGLAGGVVANNFTSKLGTGGSANKIAITCGGGPTDFIIDIFGYYP